MKFKALFLIPLIMGLSSCSNGVDIPNQDLVDKIKAILNKQDLSEFHLKSMGTMYTQDYDVLDISQDSINVDITDEYQERVHNYFNYSGVGFLDFYYVLDDNQYKSIVDNKRNVNVFDALSKGEGGYRIKQIIRTSSFTRDGFVEAKINNLDVNQDVAIKTSDDAKDLLVYNNLIATDDGVFHYDERQYFNASINKELLFGSVSTRSFREIFSKVDLFDAPSNIQHLDNLYYSICRDLLTKNDKEISDFIINNKITITIEEDYLKVNFVYPNEITDEEELDYIYPGEITGSLKFDKETYEYKEFTYEMHNLMEVYNEENGSLKVVKMVFTCSGISARDAMGTIWTDKDPTIYEDVADFLEDVSKEVVPPIVIL